MLRILLSEAAATKQRVGAATTGRLRSKERRKGKALREEEEKKNRVECTGTTLYSTTR